MDQTLELISRAHGGSEQAREELVRRNLGLVHSIVRRFRGRGAEEEDLFQIGCIGLLKAIDHFDLEFDVKFSTYAVPMIAGEIKRSLRDDGIIKVSRSLKEVAYKAYVTREQMTARMNREPTVEELAAELEMTAEELVQAFDACSEIESLQKTIYQGDGSEISLMDKLPRKDDPQEELLNRLQLEELLGKLSADERRLIFMRYFQDKTQTEIAGELGATQVQISRLEKKLLEKMRNSAADSGQALRTDRKRRRQ